MCVYIYTHVCIYIYAVVFNFGVLCSFLRVQRCSYFCLKMEPVSNQKKCFSPVKPLCLTQTLSENEHLLSVIQSSNAFKNRAYVAQHRLPVVERIHAPHV